MLKASLAAVLLSVLAFAPAACTNGARAPSSVSAKSASSSATLPTGSSDGAFTITKAMRSNLDPTQILELIGTGGEIATFCAKKADCKCRFNWTEADGTFREVDQELSEDPEVNMARCLFTQVSANITYFDVKIVVAAGDATTNALRVFIGSPNPSFNPSLNTNFVQVSRYLCRDSAPRSFNTRYYRNTLLDPKLWDIGYALNFYTTSFGLDYGATASGNTLPTGFECPPVPNDSTFDPAFDLKLYSIAPIELANPLLTGVNPASGDNTIYPPDDNLNFTGCVAGTEAACEKFSVNRHDFYLASFQDGIFKAQFCAIHKASNIASATLNCSVDASQGAVTLGSSALQNGGQDIIGFAAVPDASQNCPSTTSVKIPTGKKWAKLWRFRASLPVRTIQDAANPSDIGDLICTTRKQECQSGSTADATNTYSVCWSVINGTGPKLYPRQSALLSLNGPGFGNCNSKGATGDNQSPSAASYLSGSCTDNGKNCCEDYNNSSIVLASRRPANYTLGGDYCTSTLVGSNNAASEGGVAQDVWLYGRGGRLPCIEADTDSNGKLKLTSFPDLNGAYVLTPSMLETTGRFDFVYVVTPARVTIENMQNPNDPVGQQFTPKRFLPNSPNPVVYGLEAGSQNTDVPSQRLSQFPLCVLQDAK